MSKLRILIQTIPALGAIGLAACSPPLRGDLNEETTNDKDIFGAWELRTVTNEEGTVTWPQTQGGEYCTGTVHVWMEVNPDLTAVMTTQSQMNCPGYTDVPYVQAFPGGVQDLGGGLFQIESPEALIDCSVQPNTDEMKCDNEWSESIWERTAITVPAPNAPEDPGNSETTI